jgi:hypothetical protein
MDAGITAAARALDAGDVVAALGLVAARADPAAVALRGVALARLGELAAALWSPEVQPAAGRIEIDSASARHGASERG